MVCYNGCGGRRHIMKATALCIIVIIAGLVLAGVAAVMVPVLTCMPPEPAVYEGSILGFYEENADLLNTAAEILWQYPEFFEQWRGGPDSDDSMFTDYHLRREQFDHSMFSEGEWQMICRLFDELGVERLEYCYGSVPWVSLSLNTSADGFACLHYCHAESCSPGRLALEVKYHAQYHERFEKTTNPRWYAGYPK